MLRLHMICSPNVSLPRLNFMKSTRHWTEIYIYIKVRVLLSGYVQIQCVFYLTGNKKHSKRYQVRKNSVCQ